MTLTELPRPAAPAAPAAIGDRAVDVLLVDDHKIVGDSFATLLGLHGIHAVAIDTDVAPGTDRLVTEIVRMAPRLVLLDLELGAAGDGRAAIRPLRAAGVVVLVLSGTTDRWAAAECLEAGAAAFLDKARPFAVVLDVVQRVLAGETVTGATDRAQHIVDLAAHRRDRDGRRAVFEALTARERAVLTGIVAGCPAAEIARQSYVSLATVRTQIRSILLKLGVSSQIAAVALAREAGWS